MLSPLGSLVLFPHAEWLRTHPWGDIAQKGFMECGGRKVSPGLALIWSAAAQGGRCRIRPIGDAALAPREAEDLCIEAAS